MSLLLAMVMTFGLCGISAMAAAEGYKITISTATSGHEYKAYQVFAGDYSEGGKLSNVVWGKGVRGEDLLAALKASEQFGGTNAFVDCADAAAVAAILAENNSVADFAGNFADVVSRNLTDTKTSAGAYDSAAKTYTIEGLDAGYYFVKDEAKDLPSGAAYTDYILQVAGDVTVEAKENAPEIGKKVQENNAAGHEGEWNDIADYSVGDSVPFRVVGTVPDIKAYKTYYYSVTDRITNMTIDADSVRVYYVKGGVKEELLTSTGAIAGTELDVVNNLNVTENGFTLTFGDLKSVINDNGAGCVVVEYKATLNSDAVIGNPGNPNNVYLEYSNNPNDSGNGSDKPDDTGKTPEDEVVVFTFQLPVEKVDGSNQEIKLKGAKFALFANEEEAKKAATAPEENLGAALKFVKNADGTYTLSTGEGADAEFIVENDNGLVTVKGLDQGTYYLVETLAPAGYNRLQSEMAVTVVPTYKEDSRTDHQVGNVEELSGVKVNAADMITVENNAGAILPSTGGVGTTLFYLAGILLMAGAAFFFVRSRRNGRDA